MNASPEDIAEQVLGEHAAERAPRAHRFELRAGEAALALNELTEALPAICQAEELMVYGAQVVHPYTVERSGFHGSKVEVLALNVLSVRALASHIDNQASFVTWKTYKGGPRPVPTDCPDRLVQTLLSRAELVARIPVQVRGLSTTPVWREGQLVSARGYDPVSHMWITAPDVVLPVSLTRADAERAVAYLRDEWLSEFRFADARSFAAAVGMLVSAAMRSSLQHCPMFLVNKHEHGEGGSTLCTLATVVQTGRPPAVICVNADDGSVELEKRIDAAQLAGEMTIVLDNWRSGGVLKLDSLATIVSEAERKVRVLGLSKNVLCPNSQLVLVNGRNITVADDFLRRVVEVALDTRMANPEARTFKRPQLIADAMQERGQILTACYTIVSAYRHRRGKGARVQVKARAGFEDWVRLVAEPLRWLGLPDISAVPAELRQADPELGYITRLLPAWAAVCEVLDHQSGMTVSQVLGCDLGRQEIREVHAILGEATSAKVFDGRPQLLPRLVGAFLSRIAGRQVGQKRLIRAGITDGAARWGVEVVEGEGVEGVTLYSTGQTILKGNYLRYE